MPPPTSGEILLPPGVYRHGGNPILEETRSLACIPETRRQPQIKLPRGQWLLPLGFCPRTPESLDLLLCCSPSPTVSRGCCVLASGPGPRPALPSPRVGTADTVSLEALSPLSGLELVCSPAPLGISLPTPPHPSLTASTTHPQDPFWAFPAPRPAEHVQPSQVWPGPGSA